jgi:hypothetical protein
MLLHSPIVHFIYYSLCEGNYTLPDGISNDEAGAPPLHTFREQTSDVLHTIIFCSHPALAQPGCSKMGLEASLPTTLSPEVVLIDTFGFTIFASPGNFVLCLTTIVVIPHLIFEPGAAMFLAHFFDHLPSHDEISVVFLKALNRVAKP